MVTNDVSELKNDKQKTAAYNALVHQLPKPNYHLLKALSAFLVKIVKNSDVNKMDIRNLSIVFSPTLNIPTPVILMFLSEFDTIFADCKNGVSGPSDEAAVTQGLAADDIRSPRRQMFSELPTPAFNQSSFATNQLANRQEPTSNSVQSQQDFGFAPLQPSYGEARSIAYGQARQEGFLSAPGPDAVVARPRNLTPEDSVKQSRRESSMLLLGPGQRKSSLPMLGGDQ